MTCYASATQARVPEGSNYGIQDIVDGDCKEGEGAGGNLTCGTGGAEEENGREPCVFEHCRQSVDLSVHTTQVLIFLLGSLAFLSIAEDLPTHQFIHKY